ncbi:PKD domain-containing protein [Rurimicrobium arvi]
MKFTFTLPKTKSATSVGLILLALLSAGPMQSHAQIKKKLRALFIGNSFTYYNTMPLLVQDIANNMGDTLLVDSYAPGGYTLEQHSTDATTLTMIMKGDWNFVVLQEQSQRPAFPDADVTADVYPYAHVLDSVVHKFNNCGRTVFYRTWGYKNGDAGNCPTYPPVCTYKGMDSLLARRYNQMAVDNKGIVAAVGDVFKQIISTAPAIELYDVDNMHPSAAGSYAAAVTFYTVFFRQNPMMITFNYSVPPGDASVIRQAVFNVVYKNLPLYYVDSYDPAANFTASPTGLSVVFNSSGTTNASNYSWDFGDSKTDVTANPTHVYTAGGTYTVRLIADNCLIADTITKSVTVSGTAIKEAGLLAGVTVFPNPASGEISLQLPVPAQQISVEINNTMGQTVLSQHLSSDKINIRFLSSGMYFIQVRDNVSGAYTTLRFTKN